MKTLFFFALVSFSFWVYTLMLYLKLKDKWKQQREKLEWLEAKIWRRDNVIGEMELLKHEMIEDEKHHDDMVRIQRREKSDGRCDSIQEGRGTDD